MTYQEGKEAAREEAKEWQRTFAESDHSWFEIAETQSHFEDLARRYGLLREFKREGIL